MGRAYCFAGGGKVGVLTWHSNLDFGGRHFLTGLGLLHTFNDHLVAGGQALGDQPGIADGTVGGHVPLLDLVVLADDERSRFALGIMRDALLRDEKGVLPNAFLDLLLDKHAGQQQAGRVGENGPQRDGAGALVDGHLAELQLAVMIVARVVLEDEADRDLVLAGALDLAAG